MSYSNNTVVVDLPVNESSGLMLAGSPPMVTSSNYKNTDYSNYYVIAIRLPGVEITGLNDANTVSSFLMKHVHLNRQVVLSKMPAALSPAIRYNHALPTTAELGITFTGFPAKVQSVDPHSALSNYVYPDQSVLSVIVPGKPDLCFESGGFTGHRVQTFLQETSKIPGRRLILQDQPVVHVDSRDDARRAATDPFDLGGFVGNWFRRRRQG